MARYALVVGITEYGSGLTNLTKPVVDGEAIAQILEKHGSFQEVKRLPARWNVQRNCYEMSAKGITGKELGIALKQFLTEQATRSEALVYFSGHGFTVSDNLGEIKGYLAPSDCILEADGERIVGQHNGIPLDSLNELIRKSDLSSLVVLLDCCNSGYFLERSSIEQTLTAFSSQRDYYLIAACRSFEEAWEGEEYSVFTQALLKGLSPENIDSRGQISGDRLFDYISTALEGSGQEPIRMGWGRSITLVAHTPQQLSSLPEQFRSESPYLGLQAFEVDQATYFYGREQAVRVLLDHLSQGRFLAVIGPSGCGKSSLIKAGLLPELQRDRLPSASQWQIESFMPSEHPHQTLLKVLSQHSSTQQLVLFIDQFEEVFTLCEDETERWEFIRQMANEANRPDRLTRVIIAIRGDFLDRCAPYPETVDLINQTKPTTYVVPPLTPLELEEAIEKPALKNGVSFEPRLVSRIVADVVDRPGALPLLQYALMKLWQACITETNDPQPILTHKGYEKIGGVKGALDQRASSLYRDFAASDRQFVHHLFLELVQLGEGQEVTRRRASWERIRAIADSSEQLQRVIRLLAGSQHRLIITDTKTVEVAHEALLSEWTLLRNWIAADRENIRLGRTLETYCREWQDRFQCSEEALLTGAQLAAIAEWVEQTHPKLTEAEADYVNRSLEKRDRQLQVQLEQERQLREEAEKRAIAERQKTRGAAVAGVMLTFLSVLTVGFWQQAENRKDAAIEALIAEPQRLLNNGEQIEAMIASLRALQQVKAIGGVSLDTLYQLEQVVYEVKEFNRLEEHARPVTSVSFNSNGTLLASGSLDDTIKIWNLEEISSKTLEGHTDAIWDLEFSPTEDYLLASASSDGKVNLWNLNTSNSKPIQQLSNENAIYALSFSPNGKISLFGSARNYCSKRIRQQ
jgi:energy-coupling factor transporter ATP-binding protein EcfA2